MTEENIKRLFEKHKLYSLVLKIGKAAYGIDMKVFLVGGFVRDLLLGYENYDLDFVVEGKASDLGRLLQKKMGGKLTVYEKFGTVSLFFLDKNLKIDIVGARREEYDSPAVLPRVHSSSIQDDLQRRDFTINSIAFQIKKDGFGGLFDPFGGICDLEKKYIRILHEGSFVDDPTRIFRALRFEQRFGFTIEKNTKKLIKKALRDKMIDRTSTQRIRNELILVFKEQDPVKPFLRIKSICGIDFIFDGLHIRRDISRTFENVKKHLRWVGKHVPCAEEVSAWVVYLMIILGDMDQREVDRVMEKFKFSNLIKRKVTGYMENRSFVIAELACGSTISPGTVYGALERLPYEAIICIMATAENDKLTRRCRKYFTAYLNFRLLIDGHDVKNAGVRPGTEVRRILREVLLAKINGKVSGKKEELAYVQKLVR